MVVEVEEVEEVAGVEEAEEVGEVEEAEKVEEVEDAAINLMSNASNKTVNKTPTVT